MEYLVPFIEVGARGNTVDVLAKYPKRVGWFVLEGLADGVLEVVVGGEEGGGGCVSISESLELVAMRWKMFW